MAKTSVELREERATQIAEARRKWTEAEAREGGPTAEDKAEFDRTMDGADAILERASRLEKLETAEAELGAPLDRRSDPLDQERRDRDAAAERTGSAGRDAKVRAGYRQFLRNGTIVPELRATGDRLDAIPTEFRDTVLSTDSKGGYLIAPVQVSQDIVRQIDNELFIRRLATITRVTDAKKLGIRKKTTRMADADWTTEVQAVTEDTAMAFDRRDLEPYQLTKLALVSERTLALSADAEQEVNGELAYLFGTTQEKAFMTGNGTAKPLGVFVASANGISTGRDVACASATAIAADDLINAKFALKAGYLADPNAGWIFHRDAVKMIRKLKDSQGQYLWQAGLQQGAPDRILDVPYYMSEYAPNTFTTGLYVGLIGNFRHYRIAEVTTMVIRRLVERYSDTNQVGFKGIMWVDGAPVLEEAFSRLKLA